jgi:hypothetical protein
MQRLSSMLILPLWVVSAAQACAQSNVPDAAIAEIIRRGDLVTRTGAGAGLHGSSAD